MTADSAMAVPAGRNEGASNTVPHPSERYCGEGCRCVWCRAGWPARRIEGLGDQVSGELMAAVMRDFEQGTAA